MNNDTISSIQDNIDINITIKELVEMLDELLEEMAETVGKTKDDFTGGYIQQLKNSNRFTAFFGTKKGTTNKATAQVNIPDEDLDLCFYMLKAKIREMKNNKDKVKKVSLSDRLSKKKQFNKTFPKT